jgi:peptidoglycan hydrolase-like protein with peptidoglycan-binding domain
VKAVRSYQESANLPVTGVADAVTLAFLLTAAQRT